MWPVSWTGDSALEEAVPLWFQEGSDASITTVTTDDCGTTCREVRPVILFCP